MFGEHRNTRVGIDDDQFTINGRKTYEGRVHEGTPLDGLLFNSRFVHACFDDANPETIQNWAYPDTGDWDPDRNVAKFLSAMPMYREAGLRAIATNLQCGSPEGYSKEQPWIVSAFDETGSLKADWVQRFEAVIERADNLGMVVLLGLFYFGQDGVLADEEAVKNAVDNTLSWLFDREYTNIVIEVANECDLGYDHDIIRTPRTTELIDQVAQQSRDGYRYLVGTSLSGGKVPADIIVEASDVIFLHGNGVEDPDRIREMVQEVRDKPSYEPKPIVFNEDDHFCFGSDCNMLAAIESRASWGYFDPGENNYWHGYQSPPVRWDANTARKKAFFGYLSGVTGAESGSN